MIFKNLYESTECPGPTKLVLASFRGKWRAPPSLVPGGHPVCPCDIGLGQEEACAPKGRRGLGHRKACLLRLACIDIALGRQMQAEGLACRLAPFCPEGMKQEACGRLAYLRTVLSFDVGRGRFAAFTRPLAGEAFRPLALRRASVQSSVALTAQPSGSWAL